MMRTRPWRAPALLPAMLLAVSAWHPAAAGAGGGDSGTPMFSLSGFGTLGVVHSSETQADYTNSTFKPNGAGFSGPWSTNVDSKLGAQVTANFNAKLSAVLQVVSEQLYDNTYRPYAEWANLKYQLTPEFSVRAGRTVLSSFMFSETRKVGYANPWVRPPVEVYGLVPITNTDGVDASYRTHIGDFFNTVAGSYGRNHPSLPAREGGGTAEARDMKLISDTLEYGAASVRVSYFDARLTVQSLDALFDAFRQFGPQGIAIDGKYGPDHRRVSFVAVGAMYDPGGWFALGEWGHDNYHSVLGTNTAWYVSGGYRLARLTPYATYSEVSVNSNTSDPGLNLSALPPSLVAPAAGLNAALNASLASMADQRTMSMGARWDFIKNASLKLQYDHTRIGAGSTGSLINVQPGFIPGGTVNIISIAVNFVL